MSLSNVSNSANVLQTWMRVCYEEAAAKEMEECVVRRLAGLLVLMFGLLGLFRAATGISHDWLDAVCMTPAVVR